MLGAKTLNSWIHGGPGTLNFIFPACSEAKHSKFIISLVLISRWITKTKATFEVRYWIEMCFFLVDSFELFLQHRLNQMHPKWQMMDHCKQSAQPSLIVWKNSCRFSKPFKSKKMPFHSNIKFMVCTDVDWRNIEPTLLSFKRMNLAPRQKQKGFTCSSSLSLNRFSISQSWISITSHTRWTKTKGSSVKKWILL